MKAIQIAGVLALVIALATVSAATAATSSSGAAKVGTARTGIGRVAADVHGRTLYLFAKDKKGHSAC